MAKKLQGNKTNRYINLILTIARSANYSITEAKLKDLLGNPSKSQFYDYLKDLTGPTADREQILERIKVESGHIYKLHEKTWKAFFEANKEGEYYLKAQKQVSYLLATSFAQMDFGMSDDKTLTRKFLYLSKVQTKTPQNKFTEGIIKALLGNTKLFLTYNEKFYTVFPLTLCQYRDELYLIAYKDEMKKENLRHFKLSRISKLEESTESFTYPSPSKWDPKVEYKQTSGLIRGPSQEATIRFYGNAKKVIAEKSFFNAKKINSSQQWDEYTMSYTNIAEFLGQLFVYADECEIIGPVELQDAFAQKALAALNLNSKEEAA
jgi:predicted DNA-binding transcriptional regulator YafY